MNPYAFGWTGLKPNKHLMFTPYLPTGPGVAQYNITCNGHFGFIDDLILDGMIIYLKEK